MMAHCGGTEDGGKSIVREKFTESMAAAAAGK